MLTVAKAVAARAEEAIFCQGFYGELVHVISQIDFTVDNVRNEIGEACKRKSKKEFYVLLTRNVTWQILAYLLLLKYIAKIIYREHFHLLDVSAMFGP